MATPDATDVTEVTPQDTSGGVKVGDKFRTTRTVGDPSNRPLHQGWVGTVKAIVPADVDGAGTHEDEHVVLEFTDDDISPSRHVSFLEAQLTQPWVQWVGSDGEDGQPQVHFERVAEAEAN